VPAPPIVDPAILAAWLGGSPNPDLVDLCAQAASDAIAVVVEPAPIDADTDDVPDGWDWAAGVKLSGLGVAGDAYKALSAPGGGYQLDEVVYTDVFRMVSNLVRKYEALYAPSRAIGGLVG
jgi:hypothetical protein